MLYVVSFESPKVNLRTLVLRLVSVVSGTYSTKLLDCLLSGVTWSLVEMGALISFK